MVSGSSGPEAAPGELGLAGGDVIRAVNGVQLNSPLRALEMRESLRGADEIVLDVRRDDRELTLTYVLRD